MYIMYRYILNYLLSVSIGKKRAASEIIRAHKRIKEVTAWQTTTYI